MPEGDTIARLAKRLHQSLRSARILETRVWRAGLAHAALQGHVFERVTSHGKHLLMQLDDQRVLHSHLGMHGAWRLRRVPATSHPPQLALRLRIATPAGTAPKQLDCLAPTALELLTPAQLARHPYLTQLGPDLLGDEDAASLIGRFQAHRSLPLGEALLDQRIVAGIGNIYKSEVLFLCRVNPFRQVGEVAEADLQEILGTSQRLLRDNVHRARRRTRFGFDGNRFCVYRRSGLPCFRCGHSIRMERQGAQLRSTYWCPTCQNGP